MTNQSSRAPQARRGRCPPSLGVGSPLQLDCSARASSRRPWAMWAAGLRRPRGGEPVQTSRTGTAPRPAAGLPPFSSLDLQPQARSTERSMRVAARFERRPLACCGMYVRDSGSCTRRSPPRPAPTRTRRPFPHGRVLRCWRMKPCHIRPPRICGVRPAFLLASSGTEGAGPARRVDPRFRTCPG